MASRRTRRCVPEALWAGAAVLGFVLVALADDPLPTTANDFFAPGTQPNTLVDALYPASSCSNCHGGFDEKTEPLRPWAHSMMGQAARDPIFHACLAIANQDALFGGESCLRCHAPAGWLEGRSVPPDGSALTGADFDGVSCIVCHRMVDPEFQPGVSPPEDQDILDALPHHPVNPHSGSFIIDPHDRRRGPYLLTDFFIHQWLQSPFHQDSAMCATCHDVSNPAFERQPNGSYALNALDTPSPSSDKYTQFPLERTYSEWLMSDFALAPIDMGGRFGGNKLEVSTCQDCHMPDAAGRGCAFGEDRTDVGHHSFSGANSWVLRAVRSLYDDAETRLTPEGVDSAIERNHEMLRRASDLEAVASGASLLARITNQTGHKLPTGYPEGRRLWLNVRYFDAADTLIAERGRYDDAQALLTTADTTVIEGTMGITPEVAALTGKPVGESFHFVLNGMWVKDNRIPPRGFTNTNFAAVQAAPVGANYADGQHWADIRFVLPPGAARAEIRVYHQTTSREYIEFLRDQNTTNTAGDIAYQQWVLHGRSAPVEMDLFTLDLPCPADLTGSSDPIDPTYGIPDGALDASDFFYFLDQFVGGITNIADLTTDSDPSSGLYGVPDSALDASDLFYYLDLFAAGCN